MDLESVLNGASIGLVLVLSTVPFYLLRRAERAEKNARNRIYEPSKTLHQSDYTTRHD